MDPMISGIGRSASLVDRVAADAIRYRPIGLRGRSQAHEITLAAKTKFGRGRSEIVSRRRKAWEGRLKAIAPAGAWRCFHQQEAIHRAVAVSLIV